MLLTNAATTSPISYIQNSENSQSTKSVSSPAHQEAKTLLEGDTRQAAVQPLSPEAKEAIKKGDIHALTAMMTENNLPSLSFAIISDGKINAVMTLNFNGHAEGFTLEQSTAEVTDPKPQKLENYYDFQDLFNFLKPSIDKDNLKQVGQPKEDFKTKDTPKNDFTALNKIIDSAFADTDKKIDMLLKAADSDIDALTEKTLKELASQKKPIKRSKIINKAVHNAQKIAYKASIKALKTIKNTEAEINKLKNKHLASGDANTHLHNRISNYRDNIKPLIFKVELKACNLGSRLLNEGKIDLSPLTSEVKYKELKKILQNPDDLDKLYSQKSPLELKKLALHIHPDKFSSESEKVKVLASEAFKIYNSYCNKL